MSQHQGRTKFSTAMIGIVKKFLKKKYVCQNLRLLSCFGNSMKSEADKRRIQGGTGGWADDNNRIFNTAIDERTV